MTPEERRQFEEMKTKLENMERSIRFDGFRGANDSATQRLVSIGMGGGSFYVTDHPDDYIKTTHDGKVVRIPVFIESRF